jgi:hypothetical protein
LPSVTLGKEPSVKKRPAKPPLPRAFCQALGKGFAKCQERLSARKSVLTAGAYGDGPLPSAVLKQNSAKVTATEPGGLPAHHLCRVLLSLGARQSYPLPSACGRRHSAKDQNWRRPFCHLTVFAERCLGWYSAKDAFAECCTAKALGKGLLFFFLNTAPIFAPSPVGKPPFYTSCITQA